MGSRQAKRTTLALALVLVAAIVVAQFRDAEAVRLVVGAGIVIAALSFFFFPGD